MSPNEWKILEWDEKLLANKFITIYLTLCATVSFEYWYMIQSFLYSFLCFIFFFPVNLVHGTNSQEIATMGADPQNPEWSAGKAIDGNTNQSYLSNSCAITNFELNKNTSIWWKVWLPRPFNIAYLEIFFRSDSKFQNIMI